MYVAILRQDTHSVNKLGGKKDADTLAPGLQNRSLLFIVNQWGQAFITLITFGLDPVLRTEETDKPGVETFLFWIGYLDLEANK